MPQVDLVESLVCGGCGDPKVACETTLTAHQPDPYPYPEPDPDPDPDLPAESFRVPISGNLDYWMDINPNAVYERDDSTKGTTNPKSHHHLPPPANSQRFSGNLKPTAKAPIIALPNKIQHSGYLGQSAKKPQKGRIFPQKGVRLSDPGSPKVSCFGKVLSERERNRRRGSPAAAAAVEGGGGCWAALAAALRCFGRREEATPAAVEAGKGAGRNFPARERRVTEVPPAAEPPGLGGMKRFVSWRRAASWGGDVEVDVELKEGGHVAWSGPLDRR